MKSYNETVPMTRRYPDLPRKQLERDSKIAMKIVRAYDIERDAQKVLDLWRKYHPLLSNPRYWELLKTVWVAVGHTAVAPEFRRYMLSDRPCRNYFMTPEEHEALHRMPHPLKVYRACACENDGGISWTTSLEVAIEFASRLEHPLILSYYAERDEIFAYINRRGEDEIIILDKIFPKVNPL